MTPSLHHHLANWQSLRNSVLRMKGLIPLLLVVAAVLLPLHSLSAQTGTWTLAQCIEQARVHNIAVRQAEAMGELSEIGLRQARADRWPSLNGDASYANNFGRSVDPTTYEFSNEKIGTFSIGLSASWTVFNGFRKLNAVTRARYLKEAAEADQELAQRFNLIQVLSNYMQVLMAAELERVADAQLSVTQELRVKTEKQVERGLLAESQLLQIDARMAADREALVSASNNYDLALLDLRLLLNVFEGLEGIAPVSDDLPFAEGLPSAEAVYTQVLQSDPSLIAQSARLAAAESSLAMAKGAMYPNLSLFSSLNSGYSDARSRLEVVTQGFDTVGITSPGGELVLVPNVFTRALAFPFGEQLSENLSQTIGVSLQVPIFNGLRVRTGIEQARVQLLQEQLQLEQATNDLRAEVYRAAAQANASRLRLDAAQANEAAMTEAYRVEQKRFEAGLSETVTLFTAKSNLDQARFSAISSRYEYIFTAMMLKLYMGQTFKPED